MKAAVYIRVSTDEQTEYSPKSQYEMIARYAAAHSIELSEHYTYVDEGISGRTAARPAFQKMLNDARGKPRPFETVLVWKFSRFARSRKDSIVCKAMLKKCGIEVVSVSEPLGNDSTSVLMEALLEAMDEYYSLNLAEEVKRGMEQKFREGGVVSRPPFGYRMQEGEFVPDENEARTVRALFEGALAGRTLRSMAESLTQAGVCRANGSFLTARAIRYILQNPIYCGRAGRTLEGRWIVLPASHPPIVSEDIFDEVGALYQSDPVRAKRSEKKEKGEWALRGLLSCGACGRLLASAGKGGLQCSGYARGECKVSHWVNRERVVKALTDALGALESPILAIKLGGGRGRQSETLEKIDDALGRAERAYLTGVSELWEYASQKRVLLERRKKSQPAELPSLSLNGRFLAAFLQNHRFTQAEKRQLVLLLFESVVFDRRAGALRIKWRAKNGVLS